MRRRSFALSLCAVGILAVAGAGDALGADPPDVAAFPSPTSAPLARLAAAVVGVGLLGWGVTFWTRRRARSVPGGERIEVVARRSLGPRHHVAILDAGGRRLLIGFAGDHISTLSDLTDEQVFEEELGKSLPSTRPASQESVGMIGRFEGLDG